ncbi:MAG: hypothetical protein A2018_00195 [Alphaproteobacteria bacterium GWF2_58_20]|nr:MAG: hypothetical protein A2018_00195 [Alphaproteobacteria bacterium GWF2_58_20]
MTGSHTTYQRGLFAENVAALWLMLHGWRILARRYKTPHGEIDLIARRCGLVAFLEVKARKDEMDAAEAITPRTRRRIADAAGHYLAHHPGIAGLDLRFDAVLVLPRGRIRHIPGAWNLES